MTLLETEQSKEADISEYYAVDSIQMIFAVFDAFIHTTCTR